MPQIQIENEYCLETSEIQEIARTQTPFFIIDFNHALSVLLNKPSFAGIIEIARYINNQITARKRLAQGHHHKTGLHYKYEWYRKPVKKIFSFNISAWQTYFWKNVSAQNIVSSFANQSGILYLGSMPL